MTYSFRSHANWTEAAKEGAIWAMNMISTYIDVKFVEVEEKANLNFKWGPISGNTVGVGTMPSPWDPWGRKWVETKLDTQQLKPSEFAEGGRTTAVFIHEVMHNLGLRDIQPIKAWNGTVHDRKDQSIMSYDAADGRPATPMGIDVAALQFLYGKNMSTNLGDTIYEITDGAKYFYSIWDAGGNDTIAYNGRQDVTINLNDASLDKEDAKAGGNMSRGKDTKAFSIANGAVIENATGGSGNDALTGNEFDNVLTGNGGNDRIFGGEGADTLLGGDGDDSLTGDGGNDVIDGGAGADTAVYTNAWADYRVSSASGAVTITGADGADVLRNVETVSFANGSFATADIIDVAPVFVTRAISADENRSGLLGNIVATDRNAAQGDRVTFSLKDPNSIFAINADGKLFLKDGARLDFETSARHNVVVAATDSKGLRTESTIAVNVRDVNDRNVSNLDDANAAANVVAENAAAGSRVGFTARATDDSVDTLTYSLDNNAGGRFGIDARTGEVFVAQPSLLNFESASFHDIVVRVRSSDGSSQTMQARLEVADVAEALRLGNGSDLFTERGVTERSVDLAGGNDQYWGDANANTVFGGNGNDYIDARGGNDVVDGGAGNDWLQGRARDDRIAGGSGNDFIRGGAGEDTIDGGAGIDVAAFEGEWADYNITQTAQGIVVQDRVAGRDGRDVLVNVENLEFSDGRKALADAIDAAPVFVTRALFIDENTPGQVGVVVATDANESLGDEVKFSLKDPASQSVIDANGLLSLKPAVTLDAERSSVHKVVVVATDSKGLSSQSTITVKVRDLAEGGVRNLSDVGGDANVVAENSAAGTKVGIVARAADDVTDKLTYSLVDDAGGRFAINATTGEVTTTGVSIDFERAKFHDITVRVNSSDGSFQQAAFRIDVADQAETVRLSNGVQYYHERGDAETSVDLGGGNDGFWGSAGDDVVFAGSGNDYVSAGAGDDTIHGGKGNDWILGREGHDWLSGGTGNDWLRGGEGNDKFVFMERDFGNDFIPDFEVNGAEQDTIMFSKAIFANWASLSANMKQVDEDVTITYGSNSIVLENVQLTKLTAADFLFV